jgi:hypothetical protein
VSGRILHALAACLAGAVFAGCSDSTGPDRDPTELNFTNLRGSWVTDSLVFREAGAPNRRSVVVFTAENEVTWRFEHPQPGYVNLYLAEGGNYWRPYAIRGSEVIVEPWASGGAEVYDAVVNADALQLTDREDVAYDFDGDGTPEPASEARLFLTRH